MVGVLVKIQIPLDDIDKKILIILQTEGAKISTAEIGKRLKIPDRTVRYRINKLREKELLWPPKLQTYERKIGLGERLLLFQTYPDKEEILTAILDELEPVYYYTQTYGKYQGFMVYIMYPLVTPRIVHEIVQELQNLGIVKDTFVFDLVDYTRKAAEVEPLLPESDWNLSVWMKKVKKILKKECEIDLGLEEFPKPVDFDLTDIQVITHMVEHPDTTLKEIAERFNLHLSQVHKRVKHLEEHGVIKGIKPAFSPFKKCSGIVLFFKSREHAQKILCAFNELPYEIGIAMESRSHYNIRISIPLEETNEILQSMDLFKKYTDEFFIQFLLQGKSKGYSHLLKTYNNDTGTWEIPLEEILDIIRKHAKKK